MKQMPHYGFTIIELLIVVAIIAILAAVAVPTYVSYTKKAYFAEVAQAVGPYKLAVEGCYQGLGGGATVSNCGNGSGGVPAAPPPIGVVGSITITSDGVITATGQGQAGTDTIIWTPTPSNEVLIWSKSGTCVASGLC